MDERTHIVRWEDPALVLDAVQAEPTGLELMRAIADGELPIPPISALMGFKTMDVDRGRAAISVDPAEYHYDPCGAAHGGLAATLLDSAMCCAIQAALPAHSFCRMLDINVRYVRPMSAATGTVSAAAEITHRGRSVATARGQVVDTRGTVYATATTTALLAAG